MFAYVKVADETTGRCGVVGFGADSEFYENMGMIEQEVEQSADGSFYLAGMLPVPPAPTVEQIIAKFEQVVSRKIDETAQENDFDNILTCTKYTGFDNVFREHAEALLAWNAACWVKCHQVLDAVTSGTRSIPTAEELIAELPAFTYTKGE